LRHSIRSRGLAIFLLSLGAAVAAPRPERLNGKFIATAYSVTGITASGEYTHRHVVAADPAILPIGTRIKIGRAGRYSGEYVVADTGSKIVGRKLDIYLPSTPECMKFGKKAVRVKVIELGNGTHEAAKQADQAVKKDVDKDVAKGVVGSAATEKDWATKGAATKAAVLAESPATEPKTQKPAPSQPSPSTNPSSSAPQ
jgi:3D (Asp-Asp-Asp) domain-containing protein